MQRRDLDMVIGGEGVGARSGDRKADPRPRSQSVQRYRGRQAGTLTR